VAGADAPDQPLLRKVHDVAPHGVQIAQRVQTRHEIRGSTQAVRGDLSHTGHYAHTGDDVRAVGRFHANFAQRRIHWAHDVGHDVHGSHTHGTVKQGAHLILGGAGVHPVVRRADVVFLRSADEGEVFGAGYIVGTTTVQVAIREGLFVQGQRVSAAK